MGRPRKSSVQQATEKSVELPAAVQGATKKRGHEDEVEHNGDIKENTEDNVEEEVVPPAAKRGRKSKLELEELPTPKKLKLEFRHSRGFGHVLAVGQGDTGQLGLGEDVMEKTRPGKVAGIEEAVDISAGGMHTAALDREGRVWTFGCNDEGSLGRPIEEEEECFVPGQVQLPEKVVALSTGDSHTAALTETGKVFAWGTFRDSSGPIGLTEPMELQKSPVQVLASLEVVSISSGSDHIVMLTRDGEMYSMGNAEQGQLGRVSEIFAHRGGRRGLSFLLNPGPVKVKKGLGGSGFSKIWAGSYNTVALTKSGEVVVMGLNNYNQMGKKDGLTFFMPVISRNLSSHKWDTLSMGQHHTLGLEEGDQGRVFGLGRSEYGRLGLGEDTEDAKTASLVSGMTEPCCQVACGSAVSFAVTSSGEVWVWGMGTNGQLGLGGEDDVWKPVKMGGKQLENRSVIAVSSGGQHTVLIAKDKE